MKVKSLLLLLCIGICSIICKATPQFPMAVALKNDLSTILKSTIFYGDSCSVNISGLNGNISSIEYSGEGDYFYLPFNNITFSWGGDFGRMDYDDWGGEMVNFLALQKDENEKLYISGQLFSAEFDIIRNPHKKVITIDDHEGNHTTYTFDYDERNKLSKITIYNSWWYDFETHDRRDETKTYNVKINKFDKFGNWTDLTLYSDNKRARLHRKFTYYGEPTKVYDNGNLIVFSFVDSIDEIIYGLRCYDIQSKSWFELLPPDTNMPIMDYRISGDKVFMIFWGNAYGTSEVYTYSINESTWKYLGQSSDNCEFQNDYLIMPIWNDAKDDYDLKKIRL